MTTPLDEKANELWLAIRAVDNEMRDLVEKRQDLFNRYNHVLAMLREAEYREPPKSRWDEAMQEWVDTTLDDAKVVPLFRNDVP